MAQYCHASHEVYHEGVAQRAHNLSPVPFGAAKRAKESSYHCSSTASQTHHLVQRLGVEQGYNLAKETGRDLEEGIACATAGLRRRFAARVWRDYYKHVDARRRYANPTDEGLAAQQRDRQIEEESRRRENEERVAQYNYFAARASNRSAWARAGMG